ncbi:MAG: hypothetical protein WC233_04175 [Sphaerochaeta sp.]|jgi:hypothetical protein|nr:hypothetical protein [Spirochaetales bacterium]
MKNSYALVRKDRLMLCLTPLADPKLVAQWADDDEVVLKSSALLTRRQNDEVTFSLYSTIDYSVDRWIQDKQYVPRLLISAVVFTISYFIFSLAVRDPIPMIDELIISSALAIVTWRAVARRDSRSTLAQHRRHRLKAQASDRRPEIVEGLFAVEEYLDEMASQDAYSLSRQLCHVGTARPMELKLSLDEATVTELTTLLNLYLARSNRALLQLSDRVLQARRQASKAVKLADHIYHQTMHKGLDIGLLSLVLALK